MFHQLIVNGKFPVDNNHSIPVADQVAFLHILMMFRILAD